MTYSYLAIHIFCKVIALPSSDFAQYFAQGHRIELFDGVDHSYMVREHECVWGDAW